MPKYRTALPQLGEGVFLCYTGMETDLIFNRGVDLPSFASYPLLETEEGRDTLGDYYGKLPFDLRDCVKSYAMRGEPGPSITTHRWRLAHWVPAAPYASSSAR